MAETIDEIAYGRAICPVRALGRGAIIATVLGRTDENQGLSVPTKGLARPAGLEPATIRLEGECSIQLSYGRATVTGFGANSVVCARGKAG